MPPEEKQHVSSEGPEIAEKKLRDSVDTVADAATMKQLMEENAQLRMQLIQVQKVEAIGTLAAGIAHDFNNMLIGISGFAELALSKSESFIAKAYIEKIIKVTEQASALTSQILIVGKKAPLIKRPIDVNKFISGSLSTIRRMVQENIMITAQYTDATPVIDADEGQLYQVILNLVSNAKDMMPDGGKVTIKTGISDSRCFQDTAALLCVCLMDGKSEISQGKDNSGYVFISVSDTGPGIPEDIKNRIFEPFFTTKETGKGTGLGLSIVYSVVQSHGGCIDVISSPGKGAEFRLSFPSVHCREEEVKECPGEIPATDGKRKSILVVDDEEIVREFLETCLTEAGFNVQTVVDGKAAVELFSSSPDNFDLVILDMIMPGQLSGLDVFKKMKEIRPGQKAILSSGYSLSSDIDELLNAGISGILNKPFKIKELFETIQKSLDQS